MPSIRDARISAGTSPIDSSRGRVVAALQLDHVWAEVEMGDATNRKNGDESIVRARSCMSASLPHSHARDPEERSVGHTKSRRFFFAIERRLAHLREIQL